MKYDCVIIGSGVAGLTAALYIARSKKSVMIIEDSVLGGTTATLDKIENYPGYISISGMELIQNMIQQVSKLGVTIDFLNIKSIDFDKKTINCDNTLIEYKTLIIASGTSYKKLNIDSEDKFKFKGLSYCAVCDGALYKNKKIVVVTNGNSAKTSIDYLLNISKDIVVVDMGNKYFDSRVELFSNVCIKEIKGNNFVEGILININGNDIIIDCSAVFVILGKETRLTLYDKIDIKDGFIVSDENMHTNIEGVFVAGDVRYKSLRQIVTACSDGAIAGTEAIKFIQKI